MHVFLIDYGEVVSFPPSAEVWFQLTQESGVEIDRFLLRYWRFRRLYDEGLSAEGYWTRVLGHALAAPQLLRRLTEIDVEGWMRFNPKTVSWLRRHRDSGSRLYMLSNAPTALARRIETSELREVFDAMLFSADLGVAKPSPACFASAHSRIGGTPGDITFLDDREENVRAAISYGMRAHLFTADRVLDSEELSAG